jgi:hypothetical protein
MAVKLLEFSNESKLRYQVINVEHLQHHADADEALAPKTPGVASRLPFIMDAFVHNIN